MHVRSIAAVTVAVLLAAALCSAAAPAQADAKADAAKGDVPAASVSAKPKILKGACRPTPWQPVAGPLYKPNAPHKRVICERKLANGLVPDYLYLSNATAAAKCAGTFCWGERDVGVTKRLVVRGRVTDTHCQPIAGAEVDVFQPDSRGVYTSIHPGEEEGACRGVVVTDADGWYSFETYAPGHYGLLSGAISTEAWPIDLPPWVPRHIHLIAWARGMLPLVTQLYFAGDPVREFDFRAGLAGLSLGSMEDGLRLDPKPCTAEERAQHELVFGPLPPNTECATGPLVMRPATAAPYTGFTTLKDAAYQSICVDADFTPGTPLALCKPSLEPFLRPVLLIPVILTALCSAIALPVLLIALVLRALGVCPAKGRAGAGKRHAE